MATRRNKRGIKVKRCCVSCKYKEIDDYGKRHCTKGFDSCETCRSWRMRDELRKAGTPFGVIKTKEYLHYVLDIRDRETNSSCYVNRGPLRDINEIRKEYCATNKEINSIINL